MKTVTNTQRICNKYCCYSARNLQLGWWRFFLTCHRSASGEYQSMSNLGLLIDIRIRIATSCWQLLLCFKLGHVVHLSRCDMLPGLYGHAVCTMHCQSICPVAFPSCLITKRTSTTAAVASKSTDSTSGPTYKITSLLLHYNLKP